MSGDPEILIVSGAPRSGTTALTRLLNLHPEVLIGDERYYWRFERGGLSPELFEKDRFFDLRRDDRHWAEGRAPLPEDAEGADWASLRFVGDKYPPFGRAADRIAEAVPACRLLLILRNPVSVAASYLSRQRDPDDPWHFGVVDAIEDWNAALAAMARTVTPGKSVHILAYDELFGADGDLAAPFRLLGLDPTPTLEEAGRMHARARDVFADTGSASEELYAQVCRTADTTTYRALLKMRTPVLKDQTDVA